MWNFRKEMSVCARVVHTTHRKLKIVSLVLFIFISICWALCVFFLLHTSIVRYHRDRMNLIHIWRNSLFLALLPSPMANRWQCVHFRVCVWAVQTCVLHLCIRMSVLCFFSIFIYNATHTHVRNASVCRCKSMKLSIKEINHQHKCIASIINWTIGLFFCSFRSIKFQKR